MGDSRLCRRGADVQLPCDLLEGVALLDIEQERVTELWRHMLDGLGRKSEAGTVNAHALVQLDNQEQGREAVEPSFDGVPIGVLRRCGAPDLQKGQLRQRCCYL